MDLELALATQIEYEDYEGRSSRRRINVHRIYESDGIDYIDAYCFERKAARTFRVDRIVCFISDDGEVIEPHTFLAGIGKTQTDNQIAEQKPKKAKPRWLKITFSILLLIFIMLAGTAFADTGSFGLSAGVFLILCGPAYILYWLIGLFSGRART